MNQWSWRTIFSRQARIFSQNGEDGVLLYLLSLLDEDGPRSGYKVNRTCFEVGASIVNGNLECNTAILINSGWQGVICDAAEINHPLLRQERLTPENANRIVAKWNPGFCPSVISLDVDVPEYWVWRGMNGYNPDVFIVEYNAHKEPGERVSVPQDAPDWDGSDYFGASAGAMLDLGHARGYKLACVVNCLNMFFVREDLVPPRFEEYPLELCGPIKRHPTDVSRPWVKTKEHG